MSNFHSRVGTDVPESTQPAGDEAAAPSSAAPGETPARFQPGGHGRKRWASNGTTFWAVSSTWDEIPPDVYRCSFSPNVGPTLDAQYIDTDDLLTLPDAATNEILAEFDTFWAREAEFAKRDFVFKRGFLLWGPPGGGKTSTINLLVDRLVEDREGIVIYIDRPDTAAECLQMLRSVEPKRPLICIMEDFDTLVQRYGESQFLALLDGEAQVGNLVMLATTNYPERLDRRFVDRPSRFDTIKEIGMPSAEARRVYLHVKESSLHGAELDRWVELSDGFSIAHLKELIIGVKCLGQPLGDVVSRLREMMEEPPKSGNGADRTHAGFVGARAVRWSAADVARAT